MTQAGHSCCTRATDSHSTKWACCPETRLAATVLLESLLFVFSPFAVSVSMSTSSGHRRRGSAFGVGSGQPSVSVSAPYSMVSSSSAAPSSSVASSGGPVVLPEVIGSLRDDLWAVIRKEFRLIQQQLLPPVGPSHSGPVPYQVWFQLHLCCLCWSQGQE